MLPATNQRVAMHTSEAINQQIARRTRERIAEYASKTSQEISDRIDQLDHEWDIERALECNASAIALSGVLLSVTVDKRWLIVPGVVSGFLLQHALQGWCPPLPILRRLGFRTAAEIHQERYALKALRGDFQQVTSTDRAAADPQAAWASAAP